MIWRSKVTLKSTIFGILFGIVSAYVLVANLYAQDASDLQAELEDLEVSELWLYDDLDQALTAAKAEGKPLFVLFR